MGAPNRKSWISAAILVGVVYFGVGFVFAALANPAVSLEARFTWRLAAWVISGAAYAAHIGYEHFRLGNSPRATALHAAMAGRGVLASHSVLRGFVARTGAHFEAASQMLWRCNAVEQHVGADEAWQDGASLLNVVFDRHDSPANGLNGSDGYG